MLAEAQEMMGWIRMRDSDRSVWKDITMGECQGEGRNLGTPQLHGPDSGYMADHLR